MKCYTWYCGSVSQGIATKTDEKFGTVVFLGEDGRGRRYEKIALGRKNPAEVVNGKVIEGYPVKITLSAKDGKLEKVFFVLEKPSSEDGRVLMRVNTYGGYIRGGSGCWKKISGSPEAIISGYGAFGDAGRIGNWDDGLVFMKSGDVLWIHPSRSLDGTGAFALWIEDGTPKTASWQDWENLQAVAKAEAIIAEVKASAQVLPISFGDMPCFTFHGGQITPGIKVTKGATGPVVQMGEDGRGRKLVEVPLVGIEAGETVAMAAVTKLSEKEIPARYSWEEPTKKVIYGLTHADQTEQGAFLVRVNTGSGYTRRGNGDWKTWKGNPEVVTFGYGADGDAGRIGQWNDGLVVLHEGDVLYVRPSGRSSSYALWVEGSKLQTQTWMHWKMADGVRDPKFYVGKGTGPWGNVPTDWVGKIVTVLEFVKGYRHGEGDEMETRHNGELVSINPFVINLGWDGQDRHDVTVNSGTWVKLETDKQVRRLEGDDLTKRQALRKEAETLRDQTKEATTRSHFELLERNLGEQIQKLVVEGTFDTMPTEGWFGSLTNWVEEAKRVLAQLAEVEPAVMVLEQRQNSGEIAVDFGGHFRRMGRSGNCDYWVVRPDGTLRDPDEVQYRKRYTSEGDKKWRTVQPEELAISWSKPFTAAPHEFVIDHRPVGDCTEAQITTVNRIEREIDQDWEGAVGMSGTTSPALGNGWDLKSKPEPIKLSPYESKPLAGESLNQELDVLRGK